MSGAKKKVVTQVGERQDARTMLRELQDQQEQMRKAVSRLSEVMGVEDAPPQLHQDALCGMRMVERKVGPDVSEARQRLIRSIGRKWVSGTLLHYCFLGGTEPNREVVRKAFSRWEEVQGIEFLETTDPGKAEIRIAFLNDGSWSYVGRDILEVADGEPTMNFGWDLTTSYGSRTALHEIGHTLGFYHEHQNPNGGIVWDESKVIYDLSLPPNSWDERSARINVLDKVNPLSVDGSTYDPYSVMHYGFPAGWVLQPETLTGGWDPSGGLSDQDIATAEELYPKSNLELSQSFSGPWQAIEVNLESGEETHIPVVMEDDGHYYFESKGAFDTLLVLQDEHGKTLAADDDSGFAFNAKVGATLEGGRLYHLKVRLYQGWQSANEFGLFSWR